MDSPRSPSAFACTGCALMEHYFNVRESLVGLMLIVDSRRGLGAQDVAMLEWILSRNRFAHVLLTKADKLNRRDSQRVLKETMAAGADAAVSAQLFSAHAKQGIEEAREVMDRWLGIAIKKPRWTLVATIGADQPGMGMTNRVMLAQGEERGAS